MTGRLSSQWVRNIIGAVVAVAAIAVIVTTMQYQQWTAYRHTVVPEAVVPVGQTGTAGGNTWKIDSTKHLNRSPASFGPELPPGTVLRVITLDRAKPPPADKSCSGVITDGHRRWNAEAIGGFGPLDTDGVTTLCNKPGLLQFTFLLPQDVVPTALDVTDFDGAIIVRMLL